MKITILLGTFPWKPSGGAKVALEYANGLAANGHDVEVLFARHLPNWKRKDRPPIRRRLKGVLLGVVEALRNPRPTWLTVDPKVMVNSVRQYNSKTVPDGDVVVATFWPTAETVATLPRSKGARTYLIQHFEDWAGDADRIEKTWRLPLHKFFVAKWLYRRALSMELPSEDLTYLPNSIDSATFAPRVPPEERGVVVSMLYGESLWKGAADGIRALAETRKAVPGLQAILFGVWPRPRDLPNWIQYHCRPDRDFLIHQIFGRSALFLCPSHAEGWGLPGAESMASGCALVTTANGGAEDYATDGVTARVVPPRADREMSLAMQSLLVDSKLRSQLSRRGQSHIAKFGFDRSLYRLEKRLLSLAH